MEFPHYYNLDVINLGSTAPQGTMDRFHGIPVLGWGEKTAALWSLT